MTPHDSGRLDQRLPGTHLPADAYTGAIAWPAEDPDDPRSRTALLARTLAGLRRLDPHTPRGVPAPRSRTGRSDPGISPLIP